MAEMVVRLESLNNYSIEVKREGDKAYIYVRHGREDRAILQVDINELFEFGALLQRFAR